MESLSALAKLGLEFLRRAMRHKIIVGVCTLGGLALIMAWANFSGPVYTVTMEVKPVNASPLSRFSALLASANLPSLGAIQDSSLLPSYMELLQSDTVAVEIMKDPYLMNGMFGPAIDPKTGKWVDSVGRQVKGFVQSLFGLTPPDRPDAQDVADILNNMLVVNQDIKTQLVEIDCTSSDAQLCVRLMMAVHQASERRLNQLTLEGATAARNYISQELTKVNVYEVRSGLIDLLTSSEKQIVLARLNQAVAAQVVDLPYAMQKPSFPRPVIMILIGLVLGFSVGGFIAWQLDNKQVVVVFQKSIGRPFRPSREPAREKAS